MVTMGFWLGISMLLLSLSLVLGLVGIADWFGGVVAGDNVYYGWISYAGCYGDIGQGRRQALQKLNISLQETSLSDRDRRVHPGYGCRSFSHWRNIETDTKWGTNCASRMHQEITNAELGENWVYKRKQTLPARQVFWNQNRSYMVAIGL